VRLDLEALTKQFSPSELQELLANLTEPLQILLAANTARDLKDVAAERLWILYAAETLARAAGNPRPPYDFSRGAGKLRLTFSPNQTSRLADVLWTLSTYCDSDDEEWEELQEELADFAEQLGKSPIYYHELADDYQIGMLAIDAYSDDEDQKADLDTEFPSGGSFCQSYFRRTEGTKFWISHLPIWVLPSSIDAAALWQSYYEYREPPAWRSSRFLMGSAIPPIVVSPQAAVFLPLGLLHQAQTWATQSGLVTHSQSLQELDFYLMDDADLLLIREEDAQYLLWMGNDENQLIPEDLMHLVFSQKNFNPAFMQSVPAKMLPAYVTEGQKTIGWIIDQVNQSRAKN
jgi:hypothetical protein